jgi:hypothetical protein
MRLMLGAGNMNSGNSILIAQKTLSGTGCFLSHETRPDAMSKVKNKR